MMRLRTASAVALLAAAAHGLGGNGSAQTGTRAPASAQTVFGFRDFNRQAKLDQTFMAVPDAKLAGEHL